MDTVEQASFDEVVMQYTVDEWAENMHLIIAGVGSFATIAGLRVLLEMTEITESDFEIDEFGDDGSPITREVFDAEYKPLTERIYALIDELDEALHRQNELVEAGYQQAIEAEKE